MTFSNRTKIADTKQKIKTFKQERKNTANFIIEFEVLVMKVDMNELHAIFLLNKNVRVDIIKTILGYLPIVASKTLNK